MTAGDYLQQWHDMESELALKLSHLQCLRGRVPGGLIMGMARQAEPSDNTGDTACRTEELEREIGLLYAQIADIRRVIAYAVKRLPHVKMRSLLEMRYFSRLPWNDIADALALSPRATFRLHQRALRMVSAYLPQE